MSEIPTGTVTFLFTDIEGSTRLWSQSPEATRIAVKRHDDILRTVIEGGGGYVFATGGDAFAAAFQTTHDALAAAVEAQLSLIDGDLGEVSVRVRMGIHTGEAEERDDDYFGPVVNEVARLMSAGHGGQILVSETTERIAGGRLPDKVVLLDLGEHQLKDLDRRIRVYQATHPDLDAEFPKLLGMGEPRINLPRQLTSFFGRDRDLAELRRLLGISRLVTLTGAGGSGKTRLALEFGRLEFESYQDGVWFVDLASVNDPMVVGASVASALGVSDHVGEKILDRLVDRLSVEQTLLILDNCEHLVDATASLASELLERTDALVVLATSREPLGVRGESLHPVATLADPDAARGDHGFHSESPAVRLFVDRASLARPGIHWSHDDTRVIASICRRLDGLPLALELAAARLNVLTPGELLERLDDRFGLLVGGARDQLPRQQTLTATIDWSYQLLTDGERLLFGRLSVFSGGFTLDAIEAVCAGDGVASDRTLDLVSGLIDKSLVLVDHGRAGSRFSLLETMREYAAAKLAVTSEEDERRQAHADFYRRLAVDSFDELWGPREVGWLDRLEDEWPNMRRALAWHVDNTAQDGLLMAGSLYRFGFRRHYVPEIRAWLERFLDADPTPSSARARALNGMGTLSDQRHYFDEAISLYREYGPTGELAIVLQNAGYNKMNTGDWESARAMIAEAVDLYDATDPGLSMLLTLQGEIALQADHDPQRAVKFGEKSLELAHRTNSPETIVQALLFLGWFRTNAGDLDGGETALREALELEADMSGRQPMTGAADALLSGVALARGDVDQALLHLAQNSTLSRPLVDEDDTTFDTVWLLHLWAEAAVRQQRYAIAVVLLGAQTTAFKALHRVQHPTQHAEADHTLSKARAGLDPDTFDQAWKEGTAMSGSEAFDYAVDQLGQGE